jgi:diaminopimelate decarboxylase
VNCLLRLNTLAPLTELGRFASRGNARVVGLHVCVDGEPAALADTARFVRDLITAFGAHGVRVRTVNLGGGFDVPLNSPAGAEWFAALRERLTVLLDASLTLRFEFGRYLVDTAGTLVTVVLDVREVEGQQVVVLASGASHVGTFVGRRRRALVPQLISRAAPPNPEWVESVLVSAQEVPQDVWAPLARLPRLRPGDLMAVPNVGACGPTAGMVAFAAASMPVEVVVDRDDPDTTIAHVSRLAVTRYPEGDRDDR